MNTLLSPSTVLLQGDVLFSGKITHSILLCLEKEGLEIPNFEDVTDIPGEFLKEPTYWLDAKQVEAFLASISELHQEHFQKESLVVRAGHISCELRAWGVLDSVLRMMKAPEDIFHYPHRFMSYFISPPPPIGSLNRTRRSLSFEVPIAYDEYPFVAEFLKSSFESLPMFMGQSMAQVDWTNTKITIDWSEQVELLREVGEGDVSPEFISSLMLTLKSLETEVERKAELLKEKDSQIARMTNESQPEKNIQENLAGFPHPSQDEQLNFIKDQLLRLNDYFYRSQQIVTMLSSPTSKPSQFKAVAKRLDWPRVRGDFPKLIEQCLNCLDNINTGVHKEPEYIVGSSLQMDMLKELPLLDEGDLQQ